MTAYKAWTSRDVHFTTFPNPRSKPTAQEWEDFMDALADKFYDGFLGKLTTVGIGAHGSTMNVTGFPWWVPGWLARRMVTKVACEQGVEGDARFVVERTVMQDLRTRLTKEENDD